MTAVLLYHVHEWALLPWDDDGRVTLGVLTYCIHCPDYYVTEDMP